MVRTIILNGFPGMHTVNSPLLAYVDVICVKRSGIQYDVTFNEDAVNRQYIYSAFSGGIAFDPANPFILGTGLHPIYRNMETVFVIYKDNT